MKMIHCADLHLDSRLSAHLNGDKRKERQAELLEAFRRMVRYGIDHQVEAVLIAGDLFDTNLVSETAVYTVRQIITDNPQITFYYLKGNHDSLGIFHESEDIPDNLKLFRDSWTYYEIPFENGQLVIAGAELVEENKDRLFMELDLLPDSVNIVMLHGQEAEYKGQDRTQQIPMREFRNKSIDYLALGHIHTFKSGRIDGRGIWCYPGCLEGRGFDECGEHGFVLLDIDEDTGICEPEFIAFSSRNLYRVSVDVTGCSCTEEIGTVIEEELKEAGYDRRHLIKLVLTGRLRMETEKNLYLLKKRFEDYFYYLELCDETKLDVDYSSYVTEESLKGEYIRLLSAADEIPDDEKGILIRYGLQILAGEEID